MSKLIRKRNWCFTCFDVTDEKISQLRNLKCQFIVFQKEKCPNTGSLHLQGYIELKNAKTLSAMKKFIGKELNLRAAKGTAKENIAYCSKEESRAKPFFFFTSGSPKKQGQRNELISVQEELNNGASLDDIAESHFGTWVRYHKSFETYKNMKTPKRNWVPKVYVYYGPTGTGKSRLANLILNNPWRYTNGDWFDGYYGQEDVLFDDFKSTDLPRERWLKICDRYPCDVPIKGSFRNWCPRRIIFTTNYDPKDWYGRDKAVQRRITQILSF